MRRTETPKSIWIKFCMVVDIPDVVTYTNFGDHRLTGFWVALVKFPHLPLTFIVALTTLSHYRASVWCERGHCACAESRDPWVKGQKQLHIWNPRPRFAYSLCNFYCATTMIKSRLLSSRPILKPFSGKKIVPSKWGPIMAVFGKIGVETLDFGFATYKRHFLARK